MEAVATFLVNIAKSGTPSSLKSAATMANGPRKILAYGRSCRCHRKGAISRTDEKNDPTIVFIDSCNIELAVVVEVSRLKAVKFARNRNRAGRSFCESSTSIAEGDLKAAKLALFRHHSLLEVAGRRPAPDAET